MYVLLKIGKPATALLEKRKEVSRERSKTLEASGLPDVADVRAINPDPCASFFGGHGFRDALGYAFLQLVRVLISPIVPYMAHRRNVKIRHCTTLRCAVRLSNIATVWNYTRIYSSVSKISALLKRACVVFKCEF